jgi:ADP-heptose:LPS heptosyltransferase
MSDPRVIPIRPSAAPPQGATNPEPPRDRMVLDHLRHAARALALAARTPLLAARGLARRRPSPPVETLVQRILVIRTDRIGDMALTTGALMDLRSHFRHARITVLAPAAPLALLQGHPAVDHLASLDGGSLPDAMIGRFDMAIDFPPVERLAGARLAAATRAPWRAGFAAAGRQAFFTMPSPRARADVHIVELNRELLHCIGVGRADSEPILFATPAEQADAAARAAALGAARPRVLVHPGGHYESQRWAPVRFAEMIERLTESAGVACLVAAGPGEEALAERIAAATPDALLTGPLTVRALLGTIAASDLFIGNNSGPLHVAAALGIPTLSIAGPTNLIRFAPRGEAHEVVRREIPCSPCGRGRCWHHTCLVSIEPGEIVARAAAMLRRVPARRAA